MELLGSKSICQKGFLEMNSRWLTAAFSYCILETLWEAGWWISKEKGSFVWTRRVWKSTNAKSKTGFYAKAVEVNQVNCHQTYQLGQLNCSSHIAKSAPLCCIRQRHCPLIAAEWLTQSDENHHGCIHQMKSFVAIDKKLYMLVILHFFLAPSQYTLW